MFEEPVSSSSTCGMACLVLSVSVEWFGHRQAVQLLSFCFVQYMGAFLNVCMCVGGGGGGEGGALVLISSPLRKCSKTYVNIVSPHSTYFWNMSSFPKVRISNLQHYRLQYLMHYTGLRFVCALCVCILACLWCMFVVCSLYNSVAVKYCLLHLAPLQVQRPSCHRRCMVS